MSIRDFKNLEPHPFPHLIIQEVCLDQMVTEQAGKASLISLREELVSEPDFITQFSYYVSNLFAATR